ncbi:NPCBM/NEW2 domain-containing protein [Saccharothrix australiensis]|uniref:NPCBM/NEW2 domain-containing protein n=1 Tax=Saccharothrix australiensis TaxID=2072 RepID=A0A495W4Z0_9PSEU|nr:NPCBM/NEW2 domain-containing protein [Saccharothrix australiensis]RKT56569.1 NPCBM/NEW2 domain-containing protein [Saccharothrix australiensis]
MDGRHHRDDSTDNHPTSGPTTSRTTIAATRWAGAATGLTGALIAILTFPTALLKIAGTVVCVVIGAATLLAARDRDRPSAGLLALLAGASVATFALVIVLGSQGAPAPASTAGPTPAATTTSAPGTPRSTPAGPSSRPNTISLTDLRPVRNDATENLWTTGPMRLRNVSHDHALAATGAWCGSVRVEFALDGKYDRFSAVIGISDESAETKPLDFFVLADGRPAADFPATGRTPRLVEVPVAGVTRLVLGLEPPDGDVSSCPGPERVGGWADPLLTPAG